MRIPCILAAVMVAVVTPAMAAPADLKPDPARKATAEFAVDLPGLLNIFPPVESFVYVGAGANTCSQFGEFYRQSPTTTRGIFFSWTQGFLSGFFSGRDATLAKVDTRPEGEFMLRPPGWNHDAQWQHLVRFCDQRPLAKFMDAVIDLMEELAAAQPAATRKAH